MLVPTRRSRRKDDNSLEVRVQCPLCGGDSADVNPTLEKWNCFKCPGGGPVPAEWLAGFDPEMLERLKAAAPRRHKGVLEFGDLPGHAVAEIERRGLDPAWVVSRYGVRWDGERIFWPAGRGGLRRAVHPWEKPKTLTVKPKGLIGQVRLYPGAHVVLCEGDYGCACIPLPWVGVGVMGVKLTIEQRALLLNSRPASITVLLDSGYHKEAWQMVGDLLPFRAKAALLPGNDGRGPDDFPRSLIYELLLDRSY